jgi:chorismate mutase
MSYSKEQIIRDLLTLITTEPPPAPENPTIEDLDPHRKRIDAFDRAVLLLLNERSRVANIIGHLKKQMGIPVYVPSREEEVLQNVMEANTGPLSDQAVRRLFERIIDETRALERSLYQENEPRLDGPADTAD